MKLSDLTNLSTEDIAEYWRYYVLASLVVLLAASLAAVIGPMWLAILVGWFMGDVAIVALHILVVENVIAHRDGWRTAAYKAREIGLGE